jgi:hypothetical protein
MASWLSENQVSALLESGSVEDALRAGKERVDAIAGRWETRKAELRLKELQLEQVAKQVEQRLAAAEQQARVSTDEASTLGDQLSGVTAEKTQLENRLSTAQNALEKKSQMLRQSDEALRRSERERKELAVAVDALREDASRRRVAFELVEKSLAEQQAQKFEFQRRVQRLESELGAEQCARARFEAQHKGLADQVAWYDAQLSEASEALKETRRSMGAENAKLAAELDEARADKKAAADRCAALHARNVDLTRQCEEAVRVEQERAVQAAEQERDAGRELAARRRFAAVHEREECAARERIAELDAELETAFQLNEELRERCARLRARADQLQRVIAEQPDRDDQEPRNAVVDDDDDGGEQNLSNVDDQQRRQLLVRYVAQLRAKSKQLDGERAAKRQLETYLAAVSEKWQARMPELKAQKQRSRELFEANKHLSAQLEEVGVAEQQQRARAKELAIECRSLRVENDDLAQQAQLVLAELNGLKVGEGRKRADERRWQRQHTLVAGGDNVVEAEQVIEQQLVPFCDIVTLQEQNRRLLRAVRRLTDEHDERDQQARDNQLREALEQIDTLRDAHERQKQMVSAIVKQRDTFRQLLADQALASSSSSSSSMPPSSSSSSSQQQHPSGQVDAEYERLYAECKADFDRYKREHREHMNAVRQELADATRRAEDSVVEMARHRAAVEFERRRYELLERNTSAQQAHTDELRTRVSMLSAQIVQHQQTSLQAQAALADERVKSRRAVQRADAMAGDKRVWSERERHLEEMVSASQADARRLQSMLEQLQRGADDPPSAAQHVEP